jgi:hypothetical protein
MTVTASTMCAVMLLGVSHGRMGETRFRTDAKLGGCARIKSQCNPVLELDVTYYATRTISFPVRSYFEREE